MANQIVISSGAKVRNLNGVLTGTTGVVNSLGINVANGIPQLDGSGKILVSQLPNSVMEYKGTWNAATNTPTLVNGTGNQGDVYLCNVAGTVNFGAGAITFAVGDQAIYSGTIWQKAGGSTGTVTSVAVTETGDALTITGSPITTSGTINIGFAGVSGQYVNGAGGLTTFPSLTGYVPYTGATANVDLGTFDLTADVITGATGSFASSGNSNTFAINHSSGSGIALNITKGGNGEGLYINKTSGSGNAATIIGTLNATTLVKDGGTSSQFLKADGSVDSSTYLTTSSAASTYVPYTGATTNVNLGSFRIIAQTFESGSGILLSNSAFNTGGGGSTALNGKNTGIEIRTNSGAQFQLLLPTVSILSYNLPSSSGTLALTSDLSGYIQGSGTTNYVPKFTASGTIGNSLIYDTGTRIAIGGTSATYGVLTVQSDAGQFCIQSNTTPGKQLQIGYDHVSNNSYLSSLNQGVAFTTLALQPNGGNVHIGGSTSNGARLQVTGAATFSSSVTATQGNFNQTATSGFAVTMRNRNANQTWAQVVDVNAVDDKYFGLFDVTNSAYRMVVTNTGNVGIGTSSPSNTLDVVKAGSHAIRVQNTANTSDAYFIAQNTGGSAFFGINATGPYIYTANALDFLVITNNTERMRITSGGTGLFATTTASAGSFATASFQVGNEVVSKGALAGFFWENRSGGVTASSNWYGWYAQSATIYLYNGSANAASINPSTGIYTPLSDINKKKDFEQSTIGLNAILRLKPTLYRMKTDNEDAEKQLGFIAQEVKEFIPQAFVESGYDDNKFIGLNYNAIVAALVKSVQEQQAQIEELKALINK